MLAGALAVGAPAMLAAAAPAVQQAPGAAAQRAAVRYWTSARMTAALRKQAGSVSQAGPAKPRVLMRRLEHRLVHQERAAAPAPPWLTGDTAGRGLRWMHGGAVAAAVGKVFFTLGGADYVCSGTLVGGAHPDVVLTAAHCVTGGPRAAARRSGPPTGCSCPATATGGAVRRVHRAPVLRLARLDRGRGGGEQDDVAFVQVTPADAGRPGRWRGRRAPAASRRRAADRVRDQPGRGRARGVRVRLPGLAAVHRPVPQLLRRARPPRTGGSVRTACAMTAGDSGGPWLTGFRPRSGTGPVVAVTTYKLSGDLRVLYGAVLGPRRAPSTSEARQRSSLIWRASAKSLPVSPPSECVIRVSVTLFQEMRMSG